MGRQEGGSVQTMRIAPAPPAVRGENCTESSKGSEDDSGGSALTTASSGLSGPDIGGLREPHENLALPHDPSSTSVPSSSPDALANRGSTIATKANSDGTSKLQLRALRNRAAAQRSRDRKRRHAEQLESTNQLLLSILQRMEASIAHMTRENEALRRENAELLQRRGRTTALDEIAARTALGWGGGDIAAGGGGGGGGGGGSCEYGNAYRHQHQPASTMLTSTPVETSTASLGMQQTLLSRIHGGAFPNGGVTTYEKDANAILSPKSATFSGASATTGPNLLPDPPTTGMGGIWARLMSSASSSASIGPPAVPAPSTTATWTPPLLSSSFKDLSTSTNGFGRLSPSLLPLVPSPPPPPSPSPLPHAQHAFPFLTDANATESLTTSSLDVMSNFVTLEALPAPPASSIASAVAGASWPSLWSRKATFVDSKIPLLQDSMSAEGLAKTLERDYDRSSTLSPSAGATSTSTSTSTSSSSLVPFCYRGLVRKPSPRTHGLIAVPTSPFNPPNVDNTEPQGGERRLVKALCLAHVLAFGPLLGMGLVRYYYYYYWARPVPMTAGITRWMGWSRQGQAGWGLAIGGRPPMWR